MVDTFSMKTERLHPHIVVSMPQKRMNKL